MNLSVSSSLRTGYLVSHDANWWGKGDSKSKRSGNGAALGVFGIKEEQGGWYKVSTWGVVQVK